MTGYEQLRKVDGCSRGPSVPTWDEPAWRLGYDRGPGRTETVMIRRLLAMVSRRAVTLDADRLVVAQGEGALDTARHAVMVAGERGRGGHWTRVLTEVELRSARRPW